MSGTNSRSNLSARSISSVCRSQRIQIGAPSAKLIKFVLLIAIRLLSPNYTYGNSHKYASKSM